MRNSRKGYERVENSRKYQEIVRRIEGAGREHSCQLRLYTFGISVPSVQRTPRTVVTFNFVMRCSSQGQDTVGGLANTFPRLGLCALYWMRAW